MTDNIEKNIRLEVSSIIDIDNLNKGSGFEKLYNIPAIYYTTWLEKHGGVFKGKDVLDFGCGEGLASAGLSLFCGAKSVIGVDICEDFLQADAAIRAISADLTIPDNVSFKKLLPAASLGKNKFDVIVSWSVLEHISQDIFDSQLSVIENALRPDGYCIFQIAPLFYSPFGSHLFDAHGPWEHLTTQVNLLEKKVYDAYEDRVFAKDSWNCFITLNKFTTENFLSRINSCGLELIDIYETYVDDVPSKSLTSIFNRKLLTKNQILLIAKKK